MPTDLQVMRFNTDRLMSRCKILSTDDPSWSVGDFLWVDLTVNADFGDMPEKELEGKTVTVERFQPCEYIGVGVKIKPETPELHQEAK